MVPKKVKNPYHKLSPYFSGISTFRKLISNLEKNHPVHDHEYDFRHRRLAGDFLTSVIQLWSFVIERYGVSRAVTLDTAKTFDCFRYNDLLNKLQSYGLSPALCLWIKNFLTSRSIQVVVDGVTSGTQCTKAGVSQKEKLGVRQLVKSCTDLSDSQSALTI